MHFETRAQSVEYIPRAHIYTDEIVSKTCFSSRIESVITMAVPELINFVI